MEKTELVVALIALVMLILIPSFIWINNRFNTSGK